MKRIMLTISKCGGSFLLLKNNKILNNRIIKAKNNSNF